MTMAGQRVHNGKLSSTWLPSSATCPASNGPTKTITSNTATSFTTCGRVWSWIWVRACNNPTLRPTMIATPSAGAESSSTVISACFINERKTSCPIGSPVAQNQTVHQARPAAQRNEEENFQRYGNQRRRHHRHAHGHQHVGHHQVHHQERDVQQKTDLEGSGQLRTDESRDQHHQVVVMQVGPGFG